ncbi:two-component system sensor histidine kinase [Ecytonucleospora hepatopenaei]|uniref:Two-component system sensor histidine kinase n=1 Tax=Ecytonucleospora hepatopenaei TaxID=646526 RepID=A0A1W0E7Z6_9MICR|nr:two-component system sensor histidine kinase [Ecytonucleospora hepatopenaei]
MINKRKTNNIPIMLFLHLLKGIKAAESTYYQFEKVDVLSDSDEVFLPNPVVQESITLKKSESIEGDSPTTSFSLIFEKMRTFSHKSSQESEDEVIPYIKKTKKDLIDLVERIYVDLTQKIVFDLSDMKKLKKLIWCVVEKVEYQNISREGFKTNQELEEEIEKNKKVLEFYQQDNKINNKLAQDPKNKNKLTFIINALAHNRKECDKLKNRIEKLETIQENRFVDVQKQVHDIVRILQKKDIKTKGVDILHKVIDYITNDDK